MVEEFVKPPTKDKGRVPRGLSGRSSPRRLRDISGDVDERLVLPIGEFARVLGGGIVPGYAYSRTIKGRKKSQRFLKIFFW